MECPLKPLGDRVVMKRDRLTSPHIIIIADAARRNAPMRGIIVAKGPACEWDIEVGKAYLHGRYAGEWFNANGTSTTDNEDAEYYILTEGDLIAEVANV